MSALSCASSEFSLGDRRPVGSSPSSICCLCEICYSSICCVCWLSCYTGWFHCCISWSCRSSAVLVWSWSSASCTESWDCFDGMIRFLFWYFSSWRNCLLFCGLSPLCTWPLRTASICLGDCVICWVASIAEFAGYCTVTIGAVAVCWVPSAWS